MEKFKSKLFEMQLQPLMVGTGLDEDTSGAGEAGRPPVHHLGSEPNTSPDLEGKTSRREEDQRLKTPPATPPFPSLEMEASSSQMILQKELPSASQNFKDSWEHLEE
ncbi:hypothetical protein C2845_PM16G20270 [Panicum miliaceum]|uniref:Uncharacterized protein n=1 Tax=Panicum miliaceum TaxID=4540 RepID=A0A3L6PZ96_PANMI|nr:hypothetical protein C2845_PM16G20270 [Panicum miliaceum]